MTAKMHQMRKPEARENVRVGAFERSMAAFAAEMGQKVALTLGEYDTRRVVPLVEALTARVAWLETPLWRRALTKVERWWDRQAIPWLTVLRPKKAPPA
jgi:hypothetical protein